MAGPMLRNRALSQDRLQSRDSARRGGTHHWQEWRGPVPCVTPYGPGAMFRVGGAGESWRLRGRRRPRGGNETEAGAGSGTAERRQRVDRRCDQIAALVDDVVAQLDPRRMIQLPRLNAEVESDNQRERRRSGGGWPKMLRSRNSPRATARGWRRFTARDINSA